MKILFARLRYFKAKQPSSGICTNLANLPGTPLLLASEKKFEIRHPHRCVVSRKRFLFTYFHEKTRPLYPTLTHLDGSSWEKKALIGPWWHTKPEKIAPASKTRDFIFCVVTYALTYLRAFQIVQTLPLPAFEWDLHVCYEIRHAAKFFIRTVVTC